MIYRLDNGDARARLKIHKLILAAVAVAVIPAGFAVPAFAAGTGDSLQASSCGAIHGAFANVNGNFGFLGDDGGTPGYHHGAKGQDQGATGYNNSHTDCQS